MLNSASGVLKHPQRYKITPKLWSVLSGVYRPECSLLCLATGEVIAKYFTISTRTIPLDKIITTPETRRFSNLRFNPGLRDPILIPKFVVSMVV